MPSKPKSRGRRPEAAAARHPATLTGAQIREIRHALGWTQEDLARAMGVRFESVARWERGIHQPSQLAIRTLQRVLMVPQVAAALSEKLRSIGAEMRQAAGAGADPDTRAG